tara:strand:- start:115 stop:423 length:309 start_codon:yes stop_codon:yes gene_type:complete
MAAVEVIRPHPDLSPQDVAAYGAAVQTGRLQAREEFAKMERTGIEMPRQVFLTPPLDARGFRSKRFLNMTPAEMAVDTIKYAPAAGYDDERRKLYAEERAQA